MCLIDFLAGRHEWRVVFAPTTVGILSTNQPIGRTFHRFAIARINARPRGKTNQDLPGIEGGGQARHLIYHAALKSSLGKLD